MATLAAVEDLTVDLMVEHGLFEQGWSFKFDRAVRRLGCCNFSKKLISLSTHWAEALPEEEVRDTILHEIAHAIAGPKAGHGPAWRVQARRVGAVPKACASPEVKIAKQAPWIGTCPLCKHQAEYHRIPSRVLACSKHGSFKVEAIFQWKKNGKRVPMSEKFMREIKTLEARYDTKISF